MGQDKFAKVLKPNDPVRKRKIQFYCKHEHLQIVCEDYNLYWCRVCDMKFGLREDRDVLFEMEEH